MPSLFRSYSSKRLSRSNFLCSSEAIPQSFQHFVNGGFLVFHIAIRALKSFHALAPVVCWIVRVNSSVWPPIYAIFSAVDFKPLPEVASHGFGVQQSCQRNRCHKQIHTAIAIRYTPPPNVAKIKKPSVPITALLAICRFASICL